MSSADNSVAPSDRTVPSRCRSLEHQSTSRSREFESSRCFLEQFEEVGSCSCRKLGRIFSPQLSYKAGRIGDERRFAFLPAVRNGCEEGGIGLHQHLLRGQPFGGRLQLLRVLERHDARERDIETEVEALACKLGRAGKAVQNPAYAPFPDG